MFHKHHFFTLIALLAVFAIFFLNYFDMYYMRFVLLTLVVSVVLDLVWIFTHAGVFLYLFRNIGAPPGKLSTLTFSMGS